jgi:hypothetical protein
MRMMIVFAGGHADKQVCKIFVDGRARTRCASIDLGCSQVVLKVNNSILKRNSIIESIDASMIITYFNLKLRK